MAEQYQGRLENVPVTEVGPQERVLNSDGSSTKPKKKKRVRDRSFMRGLDAASRFQAGQGGREWYMGDADNPETTR